MRPDDDETNKHYQFAKRICEDEEFSEQWGKYLELRNKMNAATNKREADVYFKKAKRLLEGIEKNGGDTGVGNE
jgi:hypothetical protein